MAYTLTFWFRSVIWLTASTKFIEFSFFLIVSVFKKHLKIPFNGHLFFKLITLAYIGLINEFFVHIQDTEAMSCFSKLIKVFTFQYPGCAYFANIAHLTWITYLINFCSVNVFTKLDAHVSRSTHLVDVRIAHSTYGMNEFLIFFGAENKFLHISFINFTLPTINCFIWFRFWLSILTHITLKHVIILSFDTNFLNVYIFSQAHPVNRNFTVNTIN